MLPAIFGLAGQTVSADERALFRASDPLGYILFARNIDSPAQVKALTDSLRDIAGRDDLAILIDQEGGRVARLQPPHWRIYPPAQCFAEAYAKDPQLAVEATTLNHEALGLELAQLGITVNCAPVLDVPQAGAHDIIGDRAFGHEPAMIAALGRAALEGLAKRGVVGVIKHIPGHGRAEADSHEALPTVNASADELNVDLSPFAALADAPMAMTAHICYPAWDAEACATLSSHIIQSIIRERIGFDGLLMSDDLDMKALNGSVPELAAAAIAAGCDVALNCWGRMADMQGIADKLPEASEVCRRRLAAALAQRQPVVIDSSTPAEVEMLCRRRDQLLSRAIA